MVSSSGKAEIAVKTRHDSVTFSDDAALQKAPRAH